MVGFVKGRGWIVETNGHDRIIYGEEIALDALGLPGIGQASHIEPDDRGRWLADLSPVGCHGVSCI